MARVTDTEVKAIASDDIPATLDTTTFIEIATLDVDELLDGKDMSATRLKHIELYLSAHYAIIKTKFVKSEKAGSVSQSFQEKNELGLSLTHYGQMAMTLDTSGTLSKRNKATFENGASATAGLTNIGNF